MEARNGDIFLKKYAGWYSVRDEAFYDESETDRRRRRRAPRAAGHAGGVDRRRRRISSACRPIRTSCSRTTSEHPDFILPPERRNEVVSFVKGGLEDLSISRTTLDWGIPVPGAPDARHVRVGRRADQLHHRRRLPRREQPALALLAGRRARHRQGHRALPRRLLAGVPDVGGHRAAQARVRPRLPATTAGRRCRSRSATWSIRSTSCRPTASTRCATSSCARSAFGQDGNYSHEAIVNRINADLANDLGNLAQRSLSMIAKNCGGKIPEPGEFTDADKAILAAADALYAKAREAMDRQGIKQVPRRRLGRGGGCQPLFRGRGAVGEAKTDFKRMETILYVTAEVVRQVAILAQPVTPHVRRQSCWMLWARPDDARTFKALGEAGRLQPGTRSARAAGRVPALRRARS